MGTSGASVSNGHLQVHFTKIPWASTATKRLSEIGLLALTRPEAEPPVPISECLTRVHRSMNSCTIGLPLLHLLALGPWNSLSWSMLRSQAASLCTQSSQLCSETALQLLQTPLSQPRTVKNMSIARLGREPQFCLKIFPPW